MPKCGCAGTSCSCLVQGGSGVNVEGVGSAERPYIISSNILSASANGLPAATPTYVVAASTPLTPQSAMALDFNPANTAVQIVLPDANSGPSNPDLGTTLDLYVTGSATANYQFVSASGEPIDWFGTLPGTNKQGWYHFVRMPRMGNARWFGKFMG